MKSSGSELYKFTFMWIFFFNKYIESTTKGLPGGTVIKNLPANAGDTRNGSSIPGQPTPLFLTGKSHGQRSRVGHRPWGQEASDTTEHSPTKAVVG